MAKRKKQAASYLELAENKPDKLDWTTFNFLENLLVFCPMKQLSVPAESGVQFGISREARADRLCILFQIDRIPDALVTDKSKPRPDYLVFYKTSRDCIFTIIEMKGRTENGLEHGIEQMLYLRDRLREEFTAHFPFGLSATFQGILLCPQNAQVPLKQIEAERRRGFVVSPLLYHHKAELFPYISTVHKIPARYAHQALPHNDDFNFVERLLIHRALPHREQDAQFHLHHKSGNGSSGIYINYALSNDREYATLIASDAQKLMVFVKAENDEYLKKIETVLEAIGWKTKFPCRKLE